jgi:hypothetical protein
MPTSRIINKIHLIHISYHGDPKRGDRRKEWYSHAEGHVKISVTLLRRENENR